MANKLGRNYILEVQKIDDSILTVKPPFTVEFDVTKNNLSNANAGTFRIYNLSQLNRSAVRFDLGATNTFKRVTFKAGYGEQLSTIFVGNLTHAWSVREGNNFITQVDALDGGFALSNAQTSRVFPEGTPNQSVVDSVLDDLKPTVTKGAVRSFSGTLAAGTSFSGNTPDILDELTGKGFFIDNGKAFALGDNDFIPGQVDTIDASSGLLGTPVIQFPSFVTLEMLFEPRLIMYQSIKLNSKTSEASLNGVTYKVIGIHHRGIISPVVSGEAVTSVTLSSGLANPVVNT